MEQSPLLISVNNELREIDVEDVISNTISKEESINRLSSYYWFERIARCGLTYGEIDELERLQQK